MSNRMTAAEIAECARLADVVDGSLSPAGAEAYRALGSMAKRMARELAAREQERALWARLVMADRRAGATPWPYCADSIDRRDAAKQALRDIGVDVDALLAE